MAYFDRGNAWKKFHRNNKITKLIISHKFAKKTKNLEEKFCFSSEKFIKLVFENSLFKFSFHKFHSCFLLDISPQHWKTFKKVTFFSNLPRKITFQFVRVCLAGGHRFCRKLGPRDKTWLQKHCGQTLANGKQQEAVTSSFARVSAGGRKRKSGINGWFTTWLEARKIFPFR